VSKIWYTDGGYELFAQSSWQEVETQQLFNIRITIISPISASRLVVLLLPAPAPTPHAPPPSYQPTTTSTS